MSLRNYLGCSFFTVLVLLLTGCSKNPLSHLDPDTFAKAVNRYEDISISHSGIAENCGNFYVDSNPIKQVPVLYQQLSDECPQRMEKLADYLAQDPTFTGITADVLTTKDAWRLYFKSHDARGR